MVMLELVTMPYETAVQAVGELVGKIGEKEEVVATKGEKVMGQEVAAATMEAFA